MLSKTQNTVAELRRIAPALSEISLNVIKTSSDVDADIATFGRLVDMAKETILTEFRIQCEIDKVLHYYHEDHGVTDELPDELERFITDDSEYKVFVKTLHDAVIGCTNSNDLTYIKSKYYPIFDKGYVQGTDYDTMCLDLGRLSVCIKTVNANTTTPGEPWYTKLMFWKTTDKPAVDRGEL